MSTLIYTKKQPTKAGYYWVRHQGWEQIVEIRQSKDLYVHFKLEDDNKPAVLGLWDRYWKNALWSREPVPQAQTAAGFLREFIQFSQEYIELHGRQAYEEDVWEGLEEERKILLQWLNTPRGETFQLPEWMKTDKLR